MNDVVYQIYPRSFDRDLAGITARLDYLAGLGVDAVWLTPFYPSPQADNGYDVSDYCDVDPRFGDLAAFDALLARAHALGLRVIVDVVPNHCSSRHPMFRAALAAPPGSPERARFHFAPTGCGQLAERVRRPGLDPPRPGRPSGTCTSTPRSSRTGTGATRVPRRSSTR